MITYDSQDNVDVLQYLEQRYNSKAVKLIGTVTMLITTVKVFANDYHAINGNSNVEPYTSICMHLL